MLDDFARLHRSARRRSAGSRQTPILLMPVRWRRVSRRTIARRAAPMHSSGCASIPDDCWIDTFEPTLTETEVAQRADLLDAIWQAAGSKIRSAARGAGSSASHGSGRAAWIVDAVPAAQSPQKPTKARRTDVILTIATDAPLHRAAEKTATAAFWRQVWLRRRRRRREHAAAPRLSKRPSARRAPTKSSQRYRRANLRAAAAAGRRRGTDISTASPSSYSPAVDTKQRSPGRARRRRRCCPTVSCSSATSGNQAPGGRGRQAGPIAAARRARSVGAEGGAAPARRARQPHRARRDEMDVPTSIAPSKSAWRCASTLDRAQARAASIACWSIGLRVSADERREGRARNAAPRIMHCGRSGSQPRPARARRPTTPRRSARVTGAPTTPDAELRRSQERRCSRTTTDWLDKRDGQWLAECLGVDAGPCSNTSHHAGGPTSSTRAP